MFSLIRKILNRVHSYDALYDRVQQLESKIERFEKLAHENEALWEFLDDQKGMEGILAPTPEDVSDDFTDLMLRNAKTYGDA